MIPYWENLVVLNTRGSGHLLHRKEELTKGDLLSMIVYVIGNIPLINELRNMHP